MSAIDRHFVRSQFPAFEAPNLCGQAYFDNAGGTFVCAPVIERLIEYLLRLRVQPYGAHPVSREAGAWMDEAYARLAAYLNVSPDAVHLGPSSSQNLYVLAQALRSRLQAGDEIIVTQQDHEANNGVWRRLAADGVTVREWRVDPVDGHLDPAALDELIGSRTRLLAFSQCSNVVAEHNPVAQICARARGAGVLTVVDAVAAAAHGLADLAALGADVYLCSLYKIYGPHLGLMVVRPELLAWLDNQGHGFNAALARKRLLPAGPDHAQIAAAAGIAEYFDRLDRHHHPGADPDGRAQRVRTLLAAAEQPLLARLLDALKGQDRWRLLGPADPQRRGATVALLPRTQTASWFAERLARRGIIAGAGHFYAVRLLQAMGIDPEPGVLRLSFTHYTTPDEIERLITALHELA